MVTVKRRRQVAPERAAAWREPVRDPERLRAQYAEFADEDRALAALGLETYARDLDRIDHEE